MKQYVLDEPGARAPGPSSPPPDRAPRRWRWPVAVAAVAVAAGALVFARSFVDDSKATTPTRAAPTAAAPAVVAPVVAEPRPVQAAPAPSPAVEPLPSRVTHEKGRYVVDLHAAAVGPALTMLSQATHATVTGGEIVGASPARITASFVADSPLEAWKGVFGDVASFAMSCNTSGCAVRFVALAGERTGSISSIAISPLRPVAPAAPTAPGAVESTEAPMPDN